MLPITKHLIIFLSITGLGGWLFYRITHSPNRHGVLILISGGSSCGKTTVAETLQDLFAKQNLPFLRFGFDDLLHGVGHQWTSIRLNEEILTVENSGLSIIKEDGKIKIKTGLFYKKLFNGATFALKGFLDAGINVIFEGAVDLSLIKTALNKYSPFLFSVTCPLEIAEERENRRPDNPLIGLARAVNIQESLYRGAEKLFDSNSQSVDSIAKEIADYVAKHVTLIPE